MMEAAIFICSICGEPSSEICAFCTKDACANHRCDRCKRCSDCCECEVPLSAAETQAGPAEVSLEPEIEPSPQTESAAPDAEAFALDEAPAESESGESAPEPAEEVQSPEPRNPIF